ncbi:hypothetical protein L596_025572 [Steinernema carpocapsae]|uniref:Uncharacterized protein n=1 Tax=Steinernema carpocapsae TaxID=34508 RepID=A0A4U5M866_STECR|nr:hypothetical protein L596_025572 [Steinernema carpocapsae]
MRRFTMAIIGHRHQAPLNLTCRFLDTRPSRALVFETFLDAPIMTTQFRLFVERDHFRRRPRFGVGGHALMTDECRSIWGAKSKCHFPELRCKQAPSCLEANVCICGKWHTTETILS